MARSTRVGGVKKQLLEDACAEAPEGLVVVGSPLLESSFMSQELGTYVGYSSAVLVGACDFHSPPCEALARGASPVPPSPDEQKGCGAPSG